MWVGGPELLEGARLSRHKISNIYMTAWDRWQSCVNQNDSLWVKLHVDLQWLFHDCERGLARTCHPYTHIFWNHQWKFCMTKNVELFLNWFILAQRTCGMDLSFDLGACNVVSQKRIFLRTCNVFLPGTRRISTCNISWNYSLYNSKLTLGAVACCLCQKMLKQFWIKLVYQYFEINCILKNNNLCIFLYFLFLMQIPNFYGRGFAFLLILINII